MKKFNFRNISKPMWGMIVLVTVAFTFLGIRALIRFIFWNRPTFYGFLLSLLILLLVWVPTVIYGRKSSDEIQKIKAMKRKVKDLIWEIIFVLFLLAIGLTFVISGVWNILAYFQGSSKDVATAIMSGATVLLGLMILSIFIAGKFSGKLSHIWAEWVIWSLVVVMGLLFFWGLDIVITKPAQMWVSSGVENSSPVFWLIASPAFIILLIWARKSTLKNTGGMLTFVELAEEGKKKKTKNRKVKLDGK
ncbi:hypothetical protein [Lactococcus lactis]|jgi:hypothetical protein|uniref:hypothetical protein n=1 Tax=Lactococcus lactis TaxID=1358 RepID=UPI00111CF384|nr:hypothetical protein [Lactococcus lactis]TNU80830.1 hypothetical protein FIB48_00490 [Lactococcus lactis subsp. lactis]